MKNPSKQQLAAMARISQSQDLQTFREYLVESLEELKQELIESPDGEEFRLTQGGCRQLKDLLERIDTAPEVIRKTR
jgi:hypothetical protein